MECCVRYLGIFDYEKIAEMGWNDFLFVFKNYLKRHEDEEDLIYLKAWLNMAVQSTDKSGKPIYGDLKKFMPDRSVKAKPKVSKDLYQVAERLKKYRERR